MARSSFEEVARKLGANIGPTIPTRQPYFSKLEGGVQSVSLGLEKTRVELIDDRNQKRGLVYLFRWETDTIHFFTARYYRGQVPGEVILARADAILDEFIVKELDRRIPNIDDFIKLRKL